MDDIIKCPDCCTNKPWQDFLTKSGYRAKRCAQCRSYRDKSRAKPDVKARAKLTMIKRVYGLTLEDLEAMKLAQEGKCGCCTNPIEGYYIDHCHKTGVIRGLVCMPCNTGLGLFKDDPERLRNAAAYLEQNFIGRPYHKDFRNAQKSTD